MQGTGIRVMGHTNRSHSSSIQLLVYKLQLLMPGHTGADKNMLLQQLAKL